jgi:hypothetical protein
MATAVQSRLVTTLAMPWLENCPILNRRSGLTSGVCDPTWAHNDAEFRPLNTGARDINQARGEFSHYGNLQHSFISARYDSLYACRGAETLRSPDDDNPDAILEKSWRFTGQQERP